MTTQPRRKPRRNFSWFKGKVDEKLVRAYVRHLERKRKPRRVVVVSCHGKPPASHKCSKWCGQVKCMCGKPIHVEWEPDPPKAKR